LFPTTCVFRAGVGAMTDHRRGIRIADASGGRWRRPGSAGAAALWVLLALALCISLLRRSRLGTALLGGESGSGRQQQQQQPLPTPDALRSRLPVPHRLRRFVNESRVAASAILRGQDDRLLAIVGPCSIHDPTAAREYAHRLREAADAHKSDLLIFMRVYLEKPRTTGGWRGLVSDPDLSGEEDVARGLELGRRVLLDVNSAGLAAATEFLDPLVAPFFEDLVAYGSIGARTVESPMHRALAADLSMPMGFKNPRSGELQGAVNAAIAAAAPQRRLATDGRGRLRLAEAPGNEDGHVILRGGEGGPNFDNASVTEAAQLQAAAGLAARRVVVDCSHMNSGKKHEGQLISCRGVAEQVAAGSPAVGGVMIESFLEAGNQPLDPGVTKLSGLRYGQSVTDACLDFASTEGLISELAASVRARRERAVLVGWRSAAALGSGERSE